MARMLPIAGSPRCCGFCAWRARAGICTGIPPPSMTARRPRRASRTARCSSSRPFGCWNGSAEVSDLFSRAPTDMLDRSAGDFFNARRRAFFSSVMAFLRRRPNRLLSFDEVRGRLHLGGPIYRGLQTVLVHNIVGSLNRYQDFDRKFMPVHSHTATRWMRVNRAWYAETGLPPVVLYKVGEVYFVVDGNHRVSVAREQGQAFIDAEVRECRVKVPVTSDLQPEDLELLGDRVEFLERTGLDRLRPAARVEATLLGGYERMLEHLAVHRYFMG